MWSWSSERPPPKRTSILPQKSRLAGEGLGEVVVVDQPRLPDSSRDHRQGARLPKSSRVDHLRVFDLRQRLDGQSGVHDLAQAIGLPLSGRVGFGCLAQRAAQARRGLALVWVEVSVS